MPAVLVPAAPCTAGTGLGVLPALVFASLGTESFVLLTGVDLFVN